MAVLTRAERQARRDVPAPVVVTPTNNGIGGAIANVTPEMFAAAAAERAARAGTVLTPTGQVATTTPAAATANGGFGTSGQYSPQNDSVVSQLDKITASNSPTMQRAAGIGMAVANSRGLQNSSIAAQSAQKSMLDAAVPIASQEAQQLYGKNMQFQSGMTQKDLQKMQSDAAAKLQSGELASREKLLGSELASRETLQASQNATQLTAAQLQADTSKQLAALEAENRKMLQQMQNETTLSAQQMATAAASQAALSQALMAASSSYSATVSTIMSNPDLSASARQAALNAAAAQRTSDYAMIQNIYGVSVSATPTPTGTVPTGTTGPTSGPGATPVGNISWGATPAIGATPAPAPAAAAPAATPSMPQTGRTRIAAQVAGMR